MSTCVDCAHTMASATPLTRPVAVSAHGAMFQPSTLDPEPPVIRPGSQPFVRFDRKYAAKTTREAIQAQRRHDGRAKAAGE